MRNNKQRMDRLPMSPYQFPWYPGIPNRPGYNNYRYPVNVQYYPHIYDRNPYLARRGPPIIRHNISAVRRPRPTRSVSSKIKVGTQSRVKGNTVTRSRPTRRVENVRRSTNTRRLTKPSKIYAKPRRNVAKGATSTGRKAPSFSGDPARGTSTWCPP